MPSEKVIVHVIDDDEASRQSLAFLLQTAQIEVQTYASAAMFLDIIPDVGSSCVITDVRMPGMSGIDLLRRLKELDVDVPVIVITGHGDVAAGGRSDEDRGGRFPGKAVRRRGAAGQRPCGAAPSGRGRRSGTRNAPRSMPGWRRCRTANATCLTGLVAGRANKQIAYDLGISPRTVEIYRANLMNKMQAGSLSELVRMALIAGMLGSD